MPKPGILVFAEPGDRKTAIEVAQKLERRGFPHVVCPYDYAVPQGDWISGISEVYDSLSLCTAILQATKTLIVESGITVTYMRHPADLAGAASFNHEISDGRYLLGLGTSHDSILERFGIQPQKPLAHMRDYVERIHAAAPRQPLPPILIGALRRKMTHLAGEIAEGALGGNWPLSYVPELRKEIPAAKRDTFRLENIAPIWITNDRDEGLAFVRRFLGLHMRLPNYTSFFIEAGYEEEARRGMAAVEADDTAAIDASISERMADDIGIFGSVPQIRDKVEAWQAAGVTLTVSTLYTSPDQPDAIMRVAKMFD